MEGATPNNKAKTRPKENKFRSIAPPDQKGRQRRSFAAYLYEFSIILTPER
jgi:hypothetical protein